MRSRIVQAINKFETWTRDAYSNTFYTIFILTGLLYAGTAFTGLRSKEKSFSYLLTPASAFEKFLLEFLVRIVLFLILVPLLYWAVFNTEGFFVQAIRENFEFKPYSYTEFTLFPVLTSELRQWLIAMCIALGLLILTLPFAGAATFMRYPLPKTLFGVTAIFLFHVLIVYFFLEILKFNGPSHGKVLGMDGEDFIKFLTVYGIIANIVVLAARGLTCNSITTRAFSFRSPTVSLTRL
ncbi:MAG: hypothetical protein LOY03_03230 [Cyclobacteriaceae bacterium]|nr:hypothetical protein [Cyclobacteriaceae bacterium]